MMNDAVLRIEDCEVRRTPEELIAWIDSVDEPFRRDDRIDKELVKRFLEEIRPLGHLARHKYLGKPGLLLRPKIGNQQYDAEIFDTSSGSEHITRVEFTSAFRDHDLALGLEYLDEHGVMYGTGYVGRTKTGAVEMVPEMVDHKIRLDKMLEAITAGVTRKLPKPYEPNTVLTIVFDDTILYHDDDFPQIHSRFRDIMLSTQPLSKFCDVYILATTGKTLWEFGESIATTLTR